MVVFLTILSHFLSKGLIFKEQIMEVQWMNVESDYNPYNQNEKKALAAHPAPTAQGWACASCALHREAIEATIWSQAFWVQILPGPWPHTHAFRDSGQVPLFTQPYRGNNSISVVQVEDEHTALSPPPKDGYILRNASLGDFICVNITERAYTSPSGRAYYIPRLCGTAHGSQACTARYHTNNMR